MEFITNNYMWFIIGGIVILMAIIGYIADITDFGRNRVEKVPKEKPKKEKKSDKKIEEIDNQDISSELAENSISEFDTLPIDNNQDELQPITENEENILFSNEMNNEENSLPNNLENEEIDQSLFEPLPSVEESETDSNNEDISSDDDIWKF